MDSTLSGALVAYLVSSGLEWLKHQPWAHFIEPQRWLPNRLIATATAALSALGLSVGFDGDLGVLTVSGLTFAHLAAAVLVIAKQFVIQEIIYKTTVRA